MKLSDLDTFVLCIPKACPVIRTVHQINLLLVPISEILDIIRLTVDRVRVRGLRLIFGVVNCFQKKTKTHLLSTICLFIFIVGPSSPPPIENSDGRMTNLRTFAALDEEP